MSVTVDVQVNGLTELDQALAGLTERLAKKAINGALSYAATPIIRDAKQSAAKAEQAHLMQYGSSYKMVQPGLLKESIRRRRLKKFELVSLGASAGVAVYVGKGTQQKLYPRYWHFIEFGTSNMAAMPYLRPAFDRNRDVFIERFAKKLEQNIVKYTPAPGDGDNP